MSRIVQFLIALGFFCVAFCQNIDSDVQLRQGKIGFLSGATTLLGSLAKDLISRSTASSQVLSLNLTNLFILLVIKAIIFGAGAFGYGHGGYGRSIDGLLNETLTDKFNFDEFLSEKELLLMLSYLNAATTQKYECLQRVACEEPQRAKEYAFTGKILLKGSEIFTLLPTGSTYEDAISRLEDAISFGLSGGECSTKYQCRTNH